MNRSRFGEYCGKYSCQVYDLTPRAIWEEIKVGLRYILPEFKHIDPLKCNTPYNFLFFQLVSTGSYLMIKNIKITRDVMWISCKPWWSRDKSSTLRSFLPKVPENQSNYETTFDTSTFGNILRTPGQNSLRS